MSDTSQYSHDLELLPLRQGWDRGNYGAAYESEDFGAWISVQTIPKEFAGSPSASSAYQAGMAIGFFSSFEDHEIEAEWRDYVLALYYLNKSRLEAAGIAGRDE